MLVIVVVHDFDVEGNRAVEVVDVVGVDAKDVGDVSVRFPESNVISNGVSAVAPVTVEVGAFAIVAVLVTVAVGLAWGNALSHATLSNVGFRTSKANTM